MGKEGHLIVKNEFIGRNFGVFTSGGDAQGTRIKHNHNYYFAFRPCFMFVVFNIILELIFKIKIMIFFCFSIRTGMNPAVRAIVRMGIYLGCKVYFIHEVRI